MEYLWKIKLGLVGTYKKDKPSLNSNFSDKQFNNSAKFGFFNFQTSKNLFKFNLLTKFINYGGCSLAVECETVALEMRVRLPPSAFGLGVEETPCRHIS